MLKNSCFGSWYFHFVLSSNIWIGIQSHILRCKFSRFCSYSLCLWHLHYITSYHISDPSPEIAQCMDFHLKWEIACFSLFAPFSYNRVTLNYHNDYFEHKWRLYCWAYFRIFFSLLISEGEHLVYCSSALAIMLFKGLCGIRVGGQFRISFSAFPTNIITICRLCIR